MKKVFELSHRQMKEVKGGGGPIQSEDQLPSLRHCFIDGEVIFETICTIDAQCQTLYGPNAKCY